MSCSKKVRKYKKYQVKGSVAQRDSAAFFFYERGDYDRAGYLFEELLPLYTGGGRRKQILYNLAQSKYKQRAQYLLAAYYFDQYTKQYPNDELAEEAAFLEAYCYYRESDPYYLDQSSTRKAIDEFQYFVVTYPVSERVPEANDLIRELRERLAKKEFEHARLYFKISNHLAAVKAFEVFLQDFPDSRYREESYFMLIKSSLELADVSTIRRQKNRYLDAIDHYQQFLELFPQSAYLKEAESLYAKARKGLEKVLEQTGETNT